MIFAYLALTVICFFFVLKAADILVVSSSVIARHYGIPPVFIGVVLVGIGTSAPEILVTLMASLSSHPEIVLGNASGSIAANTGIAMAVIFWLYDRGIKKASAGDKAAVNNIFIALNFLFLGAGSFGMIFLLKNGIGRTAGITMLFLMAAYFYLTAVINGKLFSIAVPDRAVGKAFLRFTLSLAVLIACCKVAVASSSQIARLAGISEFIIGLTIIAVGTSLPEIITSLTAMRKGEWGLAVGDLVGSQALNLYFLLGLSAIVRPIKMGSSVFFFGWLSLFLGEICFFLWDKKIPSRVKSLVLFATYCAYLFTNVRGG
ncbi:MAG: sodium:calcium antiporter [Elusimicrobiota bacterium]|nr:sodium:calcium antiporter [Elusimicrobiota bacterium]